MTHPKAAVIQMTSSIDIKENLATAAKLIERAAKEGAGLVVLPEMFPLMGAATGARAALSIAEAYGGGSIQAFLSDQAKLNDMWIVGGTIPLVTDDPNRFRAACIVYNNAGEQVARYDKIHLFDVCIEKGVEEYKESATVEPGDVEALVVVDTPIGKLGLGVCYDIRFPVLFQSLMHAGAEIIALPAAFTVKTGAAHWKILARARSIETLCYGLFSCQVGVHAPGRSTYGHSMITNPWGEVLGILEEGIGVVIAEIDIDFLHSVRKNLPVMEHQRMFHAKLPLER